MTFTFSTSPKLTRGKLLWSQWKNRASLVSINKFLYELTKYSAPTCWVLLPATQCSSADLQTSLLATRDLNLTTHSTQETGELTTRNGFTALSHRKSSVQTTISDLSNILPLSQLATWNSPHISCTDHRHHPPCSQPGKELCLSFSKSLVAQPLLDYF